MKRKFISCEYSSDPDCIWHMLELDWDYDSIIINELIYNVWNQPWLTNLVEKDIKLQEYLNRQI